MPQRDQHGIKRVPKRANKPKTDAKGGPVGLDLAPFSFKSRYNSNQQITNQQFGTEQVCEKSQKDRKLVLASIPNLIGNKFKN